MARLGFIGDVYLGEGTGVRFDSAVIERLSHADYLVANVEGPLTARTEDAAAKATRLRTAPDRAAVLADLGVDAAVLANNHMFDFGPAGYQETAEALDSAGIARLGAGHTLAESLEPLIVEVDDLRIGLVAFSAPEIETVIAQVERPGCAPLDQGTVVDAIEALSSGVDVSIVYLHWGLTGYEIPTSPQRELAATFLDAGATAVIGCHAHVLQGIAAPEGRLVAYSLGDFAFHTSTANGRTVDQHRARQTGMILSLELTAEGVVGHETVLTRQRGLTVGLERSNPRARRIARHSRIVLLERAAFETARRRYVLRRTLRRIARRAAPWRWGSIRRGTFRALGVALRELRRR